MQTTIHEIKQAFFNYLNSEGRRWRSKLEACVENAFLGYSGQQDYLRLAWDEFGIDAVLISVIDYLDDNKMETEKVLPEFTAAINKLSEFLHATYASYHDVPMIVDAVEKEPEVVSTWLNNHHLLNYCKSMVIQYSYKPLLIKCLLHFATYKQQILVDDVLAYFEKYYLTRFYANLMREQNNSVFAKLNFSRIMAKDMLRKMPIAILEKQGFISFDPGSDSLQFLDETALEIREDTVEIEAVCDSILTAYFDKLGEDVRYSVYEHTNPFGNKKRGITRSECRERNGNRDSCIMVQTGLTLDQAFEILDKTPMDIDLVEYYEDPLHLLLFDGENRLINAFDSVLEAASLLGLKPSYIKACCRGEESHPRYIWRYGDKYLASFSTQAETSTETSTEVPTESSAKVTLTHIDADDERKIGVIVQDCMAELETVHYPFSPKQIEELTSLAWAKINFKKLYYPVLKVLDPTQSIETQRVDYKGNGRYYEQVYTFAGKQFLLTSQWYKDAKSQFINWFNSLT